MSIVIPTLATRERSLQIQRAIRSVSVDQELPALPVVVANGSRYDPDVIASLEANRAIRFFQIGDGGAPLARHFGRKQVETEYFGFLDDDDVYRPWAIRERVQALDQDPALDAVITWGERQTDDGAVRMPPRHAFEDTDLLRGMLRRNWLTSCGGLFRTATVTPEYFDPDVHYVEWTYTGFLLARHRKVRFLESDRPHFYVADTPGSLYKSPERRVAADRLMARMMRSELPGPTRRLVATKRLANLHNLAEQLRCDGRLGDALRYHVRSLRPVAGLKYLLSTRHFVASAVAQLLGRGREP